MCSYNYSQLLTAQKCTAFVKIQMHDLATDRHDVVKLHKKYTAY